MKILIDFSWIYNKYYYVASTKITKEENIGPKLCEMLVSFFLRIAVNYSNAKIYAVLDSPTTTLENFKIFEGYKQNRNKEEKKKVYASLKDIVLNVKERVPEIPFIKAKGYEADQVIAYMSKNNKGKVIIFSGDKDLLQLTSFSNVNVSNKFENGKFLILTDSEIFEKFKNSKGEDFTRVSTNKRDILKYRSLKGDSSDNLSSVFPRIKDKEIIDIIRNYWVDNQEEGLTGERIEKILEDLEGDNPVLAGKLRENKEVWLRNYKIMNLTDISEDIKVCMLK